MCISNWLQPFSAILAEPRRTEVHTRIPSFNSNRKVPTASDL